MLKLQYFGHLMQRADSLEKNADAGKNWRQEEKGTTEDEMVGWHHWLNGHELEQTLGDSEGQGSLACCSPWGRRVRYDWATEQPLQHWSLQITNQCLLSVFLTRLSSPWEPGAGYSFEGSQCLMAPHSSTLAWKIPWAEEPGRLQSMGSLRVRHDWVTSFSLFTFLHWRRKWHPTPVLLPGESQGRGSLVGCCPWGRTESDMTEAI